MRKRIQVGVLTFVILMLCQLSRLPVAFGQESEIVSPGSERVPKSNMVYKDAELLARRRQLIGCPEDYFSGRRLLTRYEFAVCVERLFRDLKISMGQLPEEFPDPIRGPLRVASVGGLSPDEFEAVKHLYSEFRDEMEKLGNNLHACDQFLTNLEEDATLIARMPLKNLPPLFAFRPGYKVDPYINAAIDLQALGKDRAIQVLHALARRGEYSVFVLCRMLFTNKGNARFRGPALGGDIFNDAWPLEPIEIVGGVPFLIVRGYALGGRAETPGMYLYYCVCNCEWNPYHFQKKTEAEKQEALQKLLSSPKWKKFLDNETRAFLAAQIK